MSDILAQIKAEKLFKSEFVRNFARVVEYHQKHPNSEIASSVISNFSILQRLVQEYDTCQFDKIKTSFMSWLETRAGWAHLGFSIYDRSVFETLVSVIDDKFGDMESAAITAVLNSEFQTKSFTSQYQQLSQADTKFETSTVGWANILGYSALNHPKALTRVVALTKLSRKYPKNSNIQLWLGLAYYSFHLEMPQKKYNLKSVSTLESSYLTLASIGDPGLPLAFFALACLYADLPDKEQQALEYFHSGRIAQREICPGYFVYGGDTKLAHFQVVATAQQRLNKSFKQLRKSKRSLLKTWEQKVLALCPTEPSASSNSASQK